MIYLITGQPGHGKTLRAIELADKFKQNGRDVYAHGVRGLRYNEAGFHELPDPTKWPDLPDGSVILLDEAYTCFPTRGSSKAVPKHVELMATHRHRGFDFIIIAQQASKQIDGFVLGLVERHEHVRRKFGLKKAVILWWDRYTTNLKVSDTKIFWIYPRKLMARNLYESTVQETTQRKVPWFFIALPILLVVFGGLVYEFKQQWTPKKPEPTKETGLVSKSAGTATPSGVLSKRPDDLVKWLKPRIPGEPWSAPAFDDRAVVSVPALYCIAVEDGRCSCITEQGTHYNTEPKLCRSMAKDGYYDPTRAPMSSQAQAPAQVQQPQQASTQQQFAGSGSLGRSRATARPYVPPEDMPHETASSWSPSH